MQRDDTEELLKVVNSTACQISMLTISGKPQRTNTLTLTDTNGIRHTVRACPVDEQDKTGSKEKTKKKTIN